MNQTDHNNSSEECPTTPALALPGTMPRQCCSQSGRWLNGSNPLSQHTSTAWADHAAKGEPRVRPGAAQVSATGCRQCGHTLPQGSRRHLNRCQNVRRIRSNGQPWAGRWNGSCPDFRCKYGYHHTIVLQSSQLDAETRLAKGHAPLESPLRMSPSVDRRRNGFIHASRMIGQQIQSCSKWQPGGCPSIIARLIR